MGMSGRATPSTIRPCLGTGIDRDVIALEKLAMDAASWLSSLAAESTPVIEEPKSEEEDAGTALEELLSMGFKEKEATEALASGGDLMEAVALLAKKRAEEGPQQSEETLEVEGIRCGFSEDGELVMLLPGDELRPGPVVGHKAPDGAVVFDGMDDWLWELYEGHKPRPGGELPAFDSEAALAALEDGAPYVWDGFASAAEIREANHALEEMFQRLLRWGKVGFNSWGARAGQNYWLLLGPGCRRQLTRGSGVWVDECAEGGHARNRRALAGQRREDACGFWDVQGGEPPPPAPVLRLFRRLEAAACR
ncbi:unnamed protein product, partial [Effrenium voratum]